MPKDGEHAAKRRCDRSRSEFELWFVILCLKDGGHTARTKPRDTKYGANTEWQISSAMVSGTSFRFTRSPPDVAEGLSRAGSRGVGNTARS